MNQLATSRSFWRSPYYQKGRWLTCALPPLAFILLEETPGLSGLDGINAAALIALSPIAVAVGFLTTAAIVAKTRWIGKIVGNLSRLGSVALMLVIVAILSPLAYLDRDWFLLFVIEIASLPAAVSLAAAQKLAREDI